ncbi:T9SS type A sorting domain-containing protein [Winogradskyella wichelsiae]|uniref:T9SS type A sorting domain-containing protein n=1 Tax=Winogradskyella wichelsiae TaxID=2697007 RepID=UPI0015C9FDAA|nr:T9SS type A sorting domain-containing protein [Winogradskyella wichelsiae]
MKKITFLFICSVLSLNLTAQQTISFESSEGFTLGDVHNQNSWISTGCGEDCNISTQLISDEQASDGNYSFKITPDALFDTQESPIMGGFYDFATPIDYTTAVVSFDVYITEQGGSDFRFALSGEDATGAGFFTVLINFGYLGNIAVVNELGEAFVDAATWEVNTWYNIRAEVAGSSITYYLDDVEVFQSVLVSDYNFTSMRFVHDNWGGDAFIDNIRINDEQLSIGEFSKDTVSHFYDQASQTFNLESANSTISNVEIYSILGSNVISKSSASTTETIDVSSLSTGVYLAKVSINGNTETIKFAKN